MKVIDKEMLIKYLISKHYNEFAYQISPIKIQKALYFLFAFFGAKARVLNLQEDTEKKLEWLFEPDFEAWAYGPVDREVYIRFKSNYYANIDYSANYLEGVLGFEKGFIDDMTTRIFSTSDFGLVDLSHMDFCWKKNFDPHKPNKSQKIDPEDIISEYFEQSLQ